MKHPGARLLLLLLLAPGLLWLLALIVLPQLDLAVLSLRVRVAPRVYEPGLAQYRTFIEEPLYWHTFVRTAVMSIIATGATLLISFPVAWTIVKLTRGRLQALLFVACLIPFWVSETVRTLGWTILLRESGVLPALMVAVGWTPAPVELLYHDATILLGLVYSSMLFMVVPLTAALESLDDAWVEAAYNLGGKNSLWFTEQIYTQFITRFNWEQGAAFGFLLLGLSTAIVWAALRLTGQRFDDVMRRA